MVSINSWRFMDAYRVPLSGKATMQRSPPSSALRMWWEPSSATPKKMTIGTTCTCPHSCDSCNNHVQISSTHHSALRIFFCLAHTAKTVQYSRVCPPHYLLLCINVVSPDGPRLQLRQLHCCILQLHINWVILLETRRPGTIWMHLDAIINPT